MKAESAIDALGHELSLAHGRIGGLVSGLKASKAACARWRDMATLSRLHARMAHEALQRRPPDVATAIMLLGVIHKLSEQSNGNGTSNDDNA